MQQITPNFGIALKNSITPTIIEYLKTPTTVEKFKKILSKILFTPSDLMRKKEAVYAECELDSPSLSDDDLIAAMTKDPIPIDF